MTTTTRRPIRRLIAASTMAAAAALALGPGAGSAGADPANPGTTEAPGVVELPQVGYPTLTGDPGTAGPHAGDQCNHQTAQCQNAAFDPFLGGYWGW
jgi:hypothetical protein